MLVGNLLELSPHISDSLIHPIIQVRIIFSGRYKGRLDDFAQAFSDQKSELQFLVIQKSAANTTAMKGTLDNVSKKMDKLVAFLERMSPEEQTTADLVERRGEAAVVDVSH